MYAPTHSEVKTCIASGAEKICSAPTAKGKGPKMGDSSGRGAYGW